jgi:hypothetical protein
MHFKSRKPKPNYKLIGKIDRRTDKDEDTDKYKHRNIEGQTQRHNNTQTTDQHPDRKTKTH